MDILQGSFRLCNWLSLRRLVSWINHLPPACWSTFWKSNFKQQFGCRFDIMDNESYIFVFWHMQLYMSWYIRSFFGFTFLNILYFIKYSCTNIFLYFLSLFLKFKSYVVPKQRQDKPHSSIIGAKVPSLLKAADVVNCCHLRKLTHFLNIWCTNISSNKHKKIIGWIISIPITNRSIRIDSHWQIYWTDSFLPYSSGLNHGQSDHLTIYLVRVKPF